MEKVANASPKRLIFYRGEPSPIVISFLCAALSRYLDGVSEGQFKQVLERGKAR